MTERFILLPARGVRERMPRAAGLLVQGRDVHRGTRPLDVSLPDAPDQSFRVLDSIHEDGPKLVEATPEVRARLRRSGLREAPLITYRVAALLQFEPKPLPGAGTLPPARVSVISKRTGLPVAGAVVTAFVNHAARIGAEAVSDGTGNVDLALGPMPAVVDRLYIRPPLSGFWGHYRTGINLPASGSTFALEEIPSGYRDCVRHFYGALAAHPKLGADEIGTGVRVGIVDTGVDDAHPDLLHAVRGGFNALAAEDRDLWQDNGTGHGTHVAGLIAARGPWRGMAPGAELRSYRAFAANRLDTTNYEILKGIIRAIDDDCHVINLSVSGEDVADDEALRRAVEEAHDRGILVVAAAGNQGKPEVGLPARYAFQDGICVSAFGCDGTFPTDSFEASEVGTQRGASDSQSFLAAFSNRSNRGEISLTAPGVGIISTTPGGGHGPMSGTSMACPVVTGLAARFLSEDLVQPADPSAGPILQRPTDGQRTVDALNLLLGRARKVFNDPKLEGDGRLQ